MPSPGFIRDEVLQSQVQAVLNVASFDTSGGWPVLCKAANRAAYGTILREFGRRGYLPVQVDTWDDGAEIQTDLGLYFAILRGGLGKDYDTKFLALLDRRKELRSIVLMASGLIVVPAVTPTASGQLSTVNDVFKGLDANHWPLEWMTGIGDPSQDPGLWPGVGNINEAR